MDKIKAWLEDSKNLPIIIACAVVFVGILAFVVVRAKNAQNAGDQVAGASGAGPGMGMAKGPGGMMPPGTEGPGMMKGGMGPGAGPGMMKGGMGPGAGPGMMKGGMGPAGAPGAAAGPGGSSPALAAAAGTASSAGAAQPMLPYRKDPFLPLSGPPTKDKILAALMPQVSHYEAPPPLKPLPLPGMSAMVRPSAIASAFSTEAQPKPQPFRRMAGVLTGARVSAILETNGQDEIVYPGMELTSGNSRVRVQSITSDEIILKTLDTKKPTLIRVNLSGATAVPTQDTGAAGNANTPVGPNVISPVY